MHATHRFTPGLRFDRFWQYQTLTTTGAAHWSQLPLAPGPHDALDPNGAWWCSRRCAAVLLRRRWQAMHMPPSLPAQPGAADVARVLQGLLPGWQVALYRQQAQAVQAVPPLQGGQGGQGPQQALPACAQALDQGGCGLLLLQSLQGGRYAQRTFWAWVMGIELQESARRAYRGQPGSRALLAMPFGGTAPWACSALVRLRPFGGEMYLLDSQQGPCGESRCLAAIALSPDDGART